LTHESAAAFPFVPLKAAGAFQDKEFRIYVLENEYLRAEICPDLGGRLISLFDKRDQSHPIPRPQRLETSPGGPRGVIWTHGLEIAVGERLNALGPVDSFPREPEEDGESAAVFVYDRQGDISWHGCWSLDDTRAELSFEIRVFNRALRPLDVSVGLAGIGDIRVRAESHSTRFLMPRRTAVFTFRILSATGFREDAIWGRGGLAQLDGTVLKLRPAVRAKGASVEIFSVLQSIQAQADLNPEVELVADLMEIGELDWIRFGDYVLEPPREQTSRPSQVEELWRKPEPSTAEDQLLYAGAQLFNHPLTEGEGDVPVVAGGEHLALLIEALYASRRGDHRRADELLEQYLGLNAEDALAWWLKSVILRRSRPEAVENAEAMNAHFLAPLEPVLRVQSFLSQGQGQGREANPLMRPLAADVDAAVDAVHHLLVAGLFEEAHQLLDELLRHRPVARLHVLTGWLFLQRSRMAFEAAHHAQAAAALAPEPPFPNRPFEFEALRDLMTAHPHPGLQPWLDLAAYLPQ
jgi:tetratricopeptide (TPR) repeat protein